MPRPDLLAADYTSLHQKDGAGNRSDTEAEAFGHALSNMQLWYAHPLITGFMTRSLPTGYESLPGYADRGWPTCESSWIALAKVKRLVSWAPVFDVVGDAQFRRQPPMTPVDLARLVASKRFTSKKGDLPMVIELNTRTIIALFRDVVELGYTELGWGDAEMVQLCEVLPFCRSLTRLILYKNQFGDESMVALAGALSKGALDHLTVCWRPTALSPCLETSHVHSPDSEHLFDVPYAGA